MSRNWAEVKREAAMESEHDFAFGPGQRVSMRVLDPDGNIVWEGFGRIELEMATQVGEEVGDGSDRSGDGL